MDARFATTVRSKGFLGQLASLVILRRNKTEFYRNERARNSRKARRAKGLPVNIWCSLMQEGFLYFRSLSETFNRARPAPSRLAD
jgi:hypothetical protein